MIYFKIYPLKFMTDCRILVLLARKNFHVEIGKCIGAI